MSKHICHFCGKSQDQVSLMIAAPADGSGICDECVQECVAIIFSHARSKNLLELPKPAEGGHT